MNDSVVVDRVGFLWNPDRDMNTISVSVGSTINDGRIISSLDAGWITVLEGWVICTYDDGSKCEIRTPHLQSVGYHDKKEKTS